MARKCFILLCAIAMAFASASAFADETVDVVYLKNGSIIKGTILELIPDVSVKIETKDKSLFVFKMSEVERIAKERVAPAPAAPAPAAPARAAQPVQPRVPDPARAAKALSVTGFAGAACVVNANDPGFSYGAGLRWTNYLTPQTGLVLAGEYTHRGNWFEINALDLKAAGILGRDLFFSVGLYASAILSNRVDYGWKEMGRSDFGSFFEIGYNFPDIPWLTAGFSGHFGLVDLFPDQVNGLGKVNQLSFHWGLWIGIRI